MKHGHDVRVTGDPSHRPLLATEVFEVDVVRIGTEHLDGDDPVECRLPTPIDDAEPAAPDRLGVVVALCLKLGHYACGEAAPGVVGIQ
jgi:hypothetical protein